jgi:DNA-binding SARP family transcriptional activator
MQFRILGPLEVVDGDRVVSLPRRKHRALLAVLLLHAREPVSVDRLLEDLWGGQPPRTASDALQNYVSQLRRALGAELIVTRSPGYLLDVAPEQTDVGRFRLLLRAAETATEAAERAATLREALGLWRGPPLADLADEPFALVEHPYLADLRLQAQKDLIDAELADGRAAQVLGEIEALVEESPYDEHLREQLMLALYRSGRGADALEAFERARRALDELGLAPGPELRALQHDILNHDPALLLARPSTAASEPIRKAITVLFAGPGDPSRSGAELDPEQLRALADRVFGETSVAAARHGGVAQGLPDGSAMAYFGVPEVHEDDARRALRAAVEARAALLALDVTPRLGVSTGEVLVADSTDGGTRVTGTPVSVARQLEQAAPAGEILLEAATARRVRGAATVEPAPMSGSLESHPVFRLVDLAPEAPADDRHLEAPLVGRQHELAALHRAFAEAQGERRCRVVTILGDAGIGKSRLAHELCTELRDEALTLHGRCVAYGGGATYAPLAEMLEQADAELAAVLEGSASVGEEHLRLRRYFESIAAERPLVLVFEDIHWAGASLLDLILYLGEQASDSPILALCLARPDLLEPRPDWPVALTVGPLPQDQTVVLLGQLAEIEHGLRARIAELAEGNPLYAEQLLAFSTEGGALDSVPPTLEALLSSRLDRLEPGERGVLQRAAVVGRELGRGAIAGLAGHDEAAEIDAHLSALVRKGLLVRARAGGVRFQHALIREVAYASLPKCARAELHERLADRLEKDPASSDALVGYHLEQAFRYLTDLAPVDGRARRLAADAGGRLGAAGVHAWKRGDTPAALNLLGRATALLPESDAFRLELCCELGVALRAAGDLHAAEDALSAAAETASASGDTRAELRARLELANVRLLSDPGGRAAEVLTAARAGRPVFEAIHDNRSLSRAYRLIAYVDGAMSCRYARSAEAAERALHFCRESGWSTAACLGDLAAALRYGPTPVAESIRRCRALLEGADLGGEANVLVQLAALEAMHGRLEEARDLVGRARALYEDLGQPALAHAHSGGARGEIELLAGEAPAAERAFRDSYGALESIGDRAYVATQAALLAEAVYLQDRHAEAMQWSRLAEEAGSADDIPTQFLWRAVRARLLAVAGETGEAEALADEAVRLAEATDALDQRAKVVFDRAEVLRLCGRDAEARGAAEDALALFDLKGNVVAAERVRALLAG